MGTAPNAALAVRALFAKGARDKKTRKGARDKKTRQETRRRRGK